MNVVHVFDDLPFACVNVRATLFTIRNNRMSSASASVDLIMRTIIKEKTRVHVLFLIVRMCTIKKREHSDVRVRPEFGNRAHPLSHYFFSLPGMDDMFVLAVDGDVAVWSVFALFDTLRHVLSIGELFLKFLHVVGVMYKNLSVRHSLCSP